MEALTIAGEESYSHDMGTIRAVLVLLMVFVGALFDGASAAPRVSAQTVTGEACSSDSNSSPMQGHYTGTWHSDGDYHFAVFGTDLELGITIDGTISATITPDGQVIGTVTGNVDAPIHDYGRHDISSGIGTITGQLSGTVAGSGSLLVLTQPVIDMHWGTFGGGHAVERMIQMPNYSFPASALDCVTAKGTISETGFPVENVVADGAGQITQAPGIGTASGSWNITSDGAGRFAQLSSQVDQFIASANVALSSDALPNARDLDQRVIRPLRALQGQIAQAPDVSRCLLQRLATWERTALSGLFSRAVSYIAHASLENVRAAGDLLRTAAPLNGDCHLSDAGAPSALRDAQESLLGQAITARDWGLIALTVREMTLSGLPAETVRSSLFAHIHNALNGSLPGRALLDVGRFAYVIGDQTDALTVYKRIISAAGSERSTSDRKRHRKQHGGTPAPLPTATPPVRTEENVWFGDLPHMTGQVTPGNPYRLSWTSVPGAARYVVFAMSNDGPVWAWSGNDSAVTYGDTALPTVAGSNDDLGPSGLPQVFRWCVLAVNQGNQIVGIRDTGR